MLMPNVGPVAASKNLLFAEGRVGLRLPVVQRRVAVGMFTVYGFRCSSRWRSYQGMHITIQGPQTLHTVTRSNQSRFEFGLSYQVLPP